MKLLIVVWKFLQYSKVIALLHAIFKCLSVVSRTADRSICYSTFQYEHVTAEVCGGVMLSK